MKWALAPWWVLVAACGFDSPRVAEQPDGAVTPRDGCTSFSTQLDTCALPDGFPLMLSGTLTFDTDTGELKEGTSSIPVVTRPVMTRGAQVRALLATSAFLMPGTRLRATGLLGFAIVASDAITLAADARIDVSGGAGGRLSCESAAAGNGDPDVSGGAGGGGGGFGAAGGRGGNGDLNNVPSMGGMPGEAAAAAPEGPIGGCPGGAGGNGDNVMNPGGGGGRAGGAVYLASAAQIVVGTGGGINAGGAGGVGGVCVIASGNAGGGGGGSGGSIFLEAPRIVIDGTLAANGGGGGEGSGNGTRGASGTPGPFGVQQAQGGHTQAGDGARGGAGGYLNVPVGLPPTELLDGGGGGGGGSVGVIRVSSPDMRLSSTISPAPS